MRGRGVGSATWKAAAGIPGLFALALLVRLPGISSPPFDFSPARQTYDALRARIIYLGASELSDSQHAVLMHVGAEVPQIEPPVMEHLAAFGYRIAGGEHLWIPRLIAVSFWLGGGVLIYRLAARLAGRPGQVTSVVLYLFLPYGILASRSFQPDPMMIMLTLGAILAIVRYHELSSTSRLVVASVASALAVLSKPPIPLFFLWGVFFSIAVTRTGVRRALSSRASWLYGAVSLAPSALYYVWGTFIEDFLRGHTESSVGPRRLLELGFWKGWGGMTATVVATPLNDVGGRRYLLVDLAVVAIVILGVLWARSSTGATLLVGLCVGYVAFGLVFTTHISTHPYYSLPLVPIVALASGPLGEAVFRRLRTTPLVAQAAAVLLCAVVVAGVAKQLGKRMVNAGYDRQVASYERIGTLVGHTSAAADIDPFDDTPLLYYAWIGSWPLYNPEGQTLQAGELERELRQVATKSGAQPGFS
jgi:4-amino-4-deoxy-L-arabinose transferase-like glycosyltransferase